MIYQNVVKKSAKFKILSFFATKLDISQRIPIYNSVVAWILNFRIVLPAKNRQFDKSKFWTKAKSQCFRQLCKIKNSVFLWDAVTALKQWARKKEEKNESSARVEVQRDKKKDIQIFSQIQGKGNLWLAIFTRSLKYFGNLVCLDSVWNYLYFYNFVVAKGSETNYSGLV